MQNGPKRWSNWGPFRDRSSHSLPQIDFYGFFPWPIKLREAIQPSTKQPPTVSSHSLQSCTHSSTGLNAPVLGFAFPSSLAGMFLLIFVNFSSPYPLGSSQNVPSGPRKVACWEAWSPECEAFTERKGNKTKPLKS